MFVRLTGQFDSRTQSQLHEALAWISSPVTIDVSEAWLGSAALGELVCLAKRIGNHKVTLLDPPLMLRRTLTVSRMDRFIDIASRTTPPYLKSA